jgi:aryl-alcohol dehydrogenase-like predicted oxidoreductase
MRYVQIPGTDIKASAICMGGGPLCAENDKDGVFALLDTYFALGGNFVDSANIYGKWLPSGRNTCDENIGAWLKSRGVRDEIIVTSKGGHPQLESMSVNRLSEVEVTADLDESLNALQCECIDLYYLHRDDDSVPVSTIIDYLNDFIKQGKIRYFGVSNWMIERIQAAQNYAEQSDQQRISANQVMWSYPEFNMTASTIPGLVWLNNRSKQYHIENHLPVIAYQSQARGYFSKLDAQDAEISPALIAQFHCAENTHRYQRARIIAKEIGVSINTVALAYVLNQLFPSIAIIGSHSVDQIRDSMLAADIHLSLDQMRYLEYGD